MRLSRNQSPHRTTGSFTPRCFRPSPSQGGSTSLRPVLKCSRPAPRPPARSDSGTCEKTCVSALTSRGLAWAATRRMRPVTSMSLHFDGMVLRTRSWKLRQSKSRPARIPPTACFTTFQLSVPNLPTSRPSRSHLRARARRRSGGLTISGSPGRTTTAARRLAARRYPTRSWTVARFDRLLPRRSVFFAGQSADKISPLSTTHRLWPGWSLNTCSFFCCLFCCYVKILGRGKLCQHVTADLHISSAVRSVRRFVIRHIRYEEGAEQKYLGDDFFRRGVGGGGGAAR